MSTGGQDGSVAVVRFSELLTGGCTEPDILRALAEAAVAVEHVTGAVVTGATGIQVTAGSVGRGQPHLGVVRRVPLRRQAHGRSWGLLELSTAGPEGLDEAGLTVARTLAALTGSYLALAADRDAQVLLAHRALHDPLTGLPDRRVLLERLAQALARLDRHPGLLAVLFVDLDDLKYVNDTYGHAAGDRLLTTCVSRIRTALRPTDLFARIGGDEFVIVLAEIDGPGAATRVAQRVLDHLAEPFRPDGETLRPSASVGMVVTADASAAADTLVSYADAAMYQAKRAGRGRWQLFDRAAHQAQRRGAAGRRDLAAGLRAALAGDELELHYQPIVDLSSGGGVPGAMEALLRWRHPRRGLLPAGEFLAVAERAGLTCELGAWVLATACRQLAAWDRSLPAAAPRTLSINLSVAELAQPGLSRRVAGLAAAAGVAPDRLSFEVDEAGLCPEAPVVAASLRELHALGCGLAVDNFGTGCCSVAGLARLPASAIKLSRSLTRDVGGSPQARAVLCAVLAVGQSLGWTVTVQGVEDAERLAGIRQLGCRSAQGFHLGRPQDAVATARLLAARSGTGDPFREHH